MTVSTGLRLGARLLVFVLAMLSMVVQAQAQAQAQAQGPAPAPGPNRLALVIGNAEYKQGRLKNPVNDAQDMARKLTELGFKVTKVENFTTKQIGRILPPFLEQIRPGDEVVFFYAGHGLQMKGANYFPAIDAEIENEDDAPRYSIDLNVVMTRLEESKAGLRLIFIDACRDNPFARSFRSGQRGLAKVGEAPSGTLIHFATRPGSVSDDGAGRNGLYTSKLLKHLATPNVPVEAMLKKVSAEVEAASAKKQEPWSEGSIKGEFYFRQLAGLVAEPVLTPEQIEQQAWGAAQAADTHEAVSAFLQEYPNSRFAPAARVKLGSLKPSTGAAAAAGAAAPAPAAAVSYPMGPQPVGTAFVDCAGCPPMVAVPPGSFNGGAPRADKARKDFTLDRSFAVGVHEVTFAEWDACAADGACSKSIDDNGWGRGDQPVINVSWTEARAYAGWLRKKTGQPYRLLHESEWEYVARAGSADPYPWGGDAGFDNANCMQCGADGYAGKRTSAVGKFNRNAFGLYDVIGNVWEWVEDCDSPQVKALAEAASDVSAACASRVLRGGGFRTASKEATLEQRRPAGAGTRSPQNGFRVARDL